MLGVSLKGDFISRSGDGVYGRGYGSSVGRIEKKMWGGSIGRKVVTFEKI